MPQYVEKRALNTGWNTFLDRHSGKITLAGLTILVSVGAAFSIYVDKLEAEWKASLLPTEVTRLNTLRDKIRDAPNRSILIIDDSRMLVIQNPAEEQPSERFVSECGVRVLGTIRYGSLRFLSRVNTLTKPGENGYPQAAIACIEKIPVEPGKLNNVP